MGFMQIQRFKTIVGTSKGSLEGESKWNWKKIILVM